MRKIDLERALPPGWFVVSEPHLLSPAAQQDFRLYAVIVAHSRRPRSLCLARERREGAATYLFLSGDEAAALKGLLGETPAKTPSASAVQVDR